jgi:hypothetical protein
MAGYSAMTWIALVAVCCVLPARGADTGRPNQLGSADDYLTCVRTLTRDPKFAAINTKLPLQDVNSISFNMLADETRPTAQEREEIAEWFDEREGCWKQYAAAIQKEWPPELIQLSGEGIAGFKAIGADLYNRKLTYGEANRRIEELGNTIKARMIPIVKQYQADIAAQKAAAE